MTLLRDDNCFISRDLLKLCRFTAEIEQEANSEALIERIVSDYLQSKYGIDRLEQSLRRAAAKRKEAIDAEAETLRQEGQGHHGRQRGRSAAVADFISWGTTAVGDTPQT